MVSQIATTGISVGGAIAASAVTGTAAFCFVRKPNEWVEAVGHCNILD
jgi:hypothetical protein